MEECEDGLKEKGVYVKGARGAMVRYLAKQQITSLSGVKKFAELGYLFNESLSDAYHYVFTRKSF